MMRFAVQAVTAGVLALVVLHASAREIYRWVDENGVVHYGEGVPEGVQDFERIVLAPSPAASPPQMSPQTPKPADDQPVVETDPAAAPAVASPSAVIPASEMSLEQLDRLCEDAREEAIAPLREAAIEECKATPKTDPAYCERFYATYGDAVQIRPGVMRPRLFDDLPACVLAREERRRPR